MREATLALFLSLAAAALAADGSPGGGAGSPVVLNEIHYHPEGDADAEQEFIELHNRTGAEIDLRGWELRDAVRFRFDPERGPAVISARGFLLVARNPQGFSRAAGIPRERIAGPYAGKLSNHHDRVSLFDAAGREREAVEYRQDGAWPARADGLGASLQRVSAEAAASLPQNWRVATGPRVLPDERVIFENGARVRWYENVDGSDPGFSGRRLWNDPAFDDHANGWQDGRTAVGYDVNNRGAQRWINTDASPLAGLHSILARLEFEWPGDTIPGDTVPGATTPGNTVPADTIPGDTLRLYMDWDDGVVVWLNGVEIVRKSMRFAAGEPPPESGLYLGLAMTAGGDEETETSWQLVWSGERKALRPGRNLLAIGNYNSSARSSDLFATAKLTVGSGAVLADMTPGRANSVAAPSPPPLVTFLERVPREPRPADAVIVRARVEGKGIERVELIHDRADSPEAREPLRDDGKGPDPVAGDGIYSAAIPPASDLSVVRFRIEARDAARGVGLFPREGNPSPWAGYYVVDRPPNSNEDLLVYHMLWRGRLRCGRGQYTGGSTFVQGGTAYLDVGFKYRGETSCGRPKSGMRVRFNKGDSFDGQSKLNLLGLWEDRSLLKEKIAWDLFRDIGHPHCRANLAAVYTGAGFLGLYVSLEDPGENYLRRNGLDPGDAMWKCRSSAQPGQGIGAIKLTASDDPDDDAELSEFLVRLHALQGEEHLRFLQENVDVESFIEYQAVKGLISDQDGFAKNWLLFHGTRRDEAGRVQHRWTAHPWDLDLSFGQTNLSQDAIVLDSHPLMGTIDNARHGTGWNGLIEAVFGRRSEDYFVKALYGRMWSLLRDKFNPEILGRKIDRLIANTLEESRADLEKWPRWGVEPTSPDYHRDRLREYIDARWNYLTDLLSNENRTVAREWALRGILPGRRRGPSDATAYRTFQYTPAPRLVITEIHYHPRVDSELEFIEVKNLEAKAVDLSGWDIPAVGYTFPAESAAPAGGVFLVARDPARLEKRHGGLAGVKIYGPYPKRLSDSGEDLRLRDNGLYRGRKYFPETIDAVEYRDRGPWPAAADGQGPSLELADPLLDNDLPASWRASREEGGTPGR